MNLIYSIAFTHLLEFIWGFLPPDSFTSLSIRSFWVCLKRATWGTELNFRTLPFLHLVSNSRYFPDPS